MSLLPLVRVVTNDMCSGVLANTSQVEPLNINLMVDLHCIDPKVVEHIPAVNSLLINDIPVTFTNSLDVGFTISNFHTVLGVLGRCAKIPQIQVVAITLFNEYNALNGMN